MEAIPDARPPAEATQEDKGARGRRARLSRLEAARKQAEGVRQALVLPAGLCHAAADALSRCRDCLKGDEQ